MTEAEYKVQIALGSLTLYMRARATMNYKDADLELLRAIALYDEVYILRVKAIELLQRYGESLPLQGIK